MQELSERRSGMHFWGPVMADQQHSIWDRWKLYRSDLISLFASRASNNPNTDDPHDGFMAYSRHWPHSTVERLPYFPDMIGALEQLMKFTFIPRSTFTWTVKANLVHDGISCNLIVAFNNFLLMKNSFPRLFEDFLDDARRNLHVTHTIITRSLRWTLLATKIPYSEWDSKV